LNDFDEAAYAPFSWDVKRGAVGAVLAHARSDADTGVLQGNAEEAILLAITPRVFIADVVRFAEVAANRIEADHKAFAKDHGKGAFQFV
jgi:hypothetical protein